MSDGGITPVNQLEKALLEKNRAQIVRFIAEGQMLARPYLAVRFGDPASPDSVAMLVLKLAITRRELFFLCRTQRSEACRKLAALAFAQLPDRPNAAEKKLIDAVVRADSAEVLKLVREKPGTLRNFAPELLIMLPELTREATLAFLTAGFAPAVVPEVFAFLLREAEEPEVLADLPYRKRLMYANLLIHILQGEAPGADEDWYPMGNSVEEGCDRSVYSRPHSYCFDPRHRYRPRSVDDEYEKPAHDVRRS